ncbi:MAG: metal-dependent hydrolase, partial [bacterium]|nr:metal-dependent hydrolase [bacterium]
MTIPEHLMIGFSFANIFYAIQSLFKFKKINYLLLVLLLAIAAAFPDIDSFFGYYTSTNPLIGHRGATHSIAGAIVSGFILTLTALLISAIFLRKKYLTMRVFFLLFFISSLAGISHVLADLPQPPSVWKGIPVFFPLKSGGQYMRHGGWS